MQGMRGFGNALAVALISIMLILGALSISLVEFAPEARPTATSSLIPSPVPLTATETLIPTLAPTLSLDSPTPSDTSTPTMTFLPPANCLIPLGWGQITIQIGDTLESIATRYQISVNDLQRANCLFSTSLSPGTTLYIPLVATNTPVACIPGAVGWIKNYIVKAGDNLYRIAVDHYSTLELMRKVNCRTGDIIYPGEVLWVPNIIATRTPAPTSLPGSVVTPYPTDPLTETALPFTATFAPTNTPLPTNTLAGVPTIFP